MKCGHDGLKCGDLCLGVDVGGDAAAVVCHAHTAIGHERYFDVVGMASHSLVARVVEDFRNEVVETGDIGRTDIHTRATTDRFEALEDRDLLGTVLGSCWFLGVFFCHKVVRIIARKAHIRHMTKPAFVP